MESCPFCSIIDSSASAAIVVRDDAGVGFLDRSPVFKGHVLVVPRLHVATLTELAAQDVGPFFALVQRVAAAVQRGLDADGTFVAMNNTVSQSVAHLHAHVVPRRRKDGLRGFFWPRQRYADADEMERFATAVRDALN